MPKVLLVINAGSSSLKFAVFSKGQEKLRGTVEQIGGRSRFLIHPAPRQSTGASPWMNVSSLLQERTPKAKAVGPWGWVHQPTSSAMKNVRVATLPVAFRLVRQTLARSGIQPTAVAHRIVHGGDVFFRPTRLTSSVLARLKKFTSLAALHMPANLAGVRLARQAWPAALQWGVFDTAPYHNLPEHSRLYAIPMAVAKRFHIRKYGFHGISHHWAMKQAAKKLGRSPANLNLVTIHLGSGDSMTLWRQGKAVDTTMGFTPLEGLTMSTRSGDLDPMIPLWLQQHGYSLKRVIDMLQNRSGLFGISGLRDMRDILAATGHPIPNWPVRRWSAKQRRQSKLAIKMFTYDVQRYLSSYCGLVPKIDAIVFTGAIGRNRYLQKKILDGLASSQYRRLTIPTDEERAIAETVSKLIH